MSSFLHKFLHTNTISNSTMCNKFCSQLQDAVICVYDEAGNMTDTQKHKAISRDGDFYSYHDGVPAKTGSYDSAFIAVFPK